MYHYVRGQGWVAGPEYETLESTMDGQPVRFEARMPEKGEYYSWVNESDYDYLINKNTPKLSEFARTWRLYPFEILGKYDPEFHKGRTVGRIYITITPI